MEKDFTTYDQALSLKELGYDRECFAWHVSKEWGLEFGRVIKSDLINDAVLAPAYSQALRWFRDEYGLSGLIEIGTQEFSYGVFNNKGNRQLGTEPLKYNGTYEEAQSTCLDKLITLVTLTQ
jgi:hypothetical protein